jgi:uncharacterized protein YdcH (DUF465 family)
MPTDADELKLRLLESDEEFRQLAAQHQDLDQRLNTLSSKPYLTEPEQFELMTLKKRKLQLKDRMEDILRRHRQMVTGTTAAQASSSPAARS